MKILFIDHIGSFSKDIINALSKEHEVKLVPKQHSIYAPFIIEKEKPDIVWFEWCDEPLIYASNIPKGNYKVINRLHSYEIFSSNTYRINWNYVDDLIFVSEHTKELFELNKDIVVNKHVIYNGVDLEKFKYDENKKYNKKLAYVGYLNSKKNIHLLFQCYKALKNKDKEYSLHIAGKWQEERLKLNCLDFIRKTNLEDIVFYDQVEDIPLWLKDKSYILSTSLFESFQYSIAEGIACGCLPIIYNWYGADKLYPEDSLFLTIEEFLGTIKYYDSKNKTLLAEENRKFIERYSLKKQIESIKKIIDNEN